MQRGIYVAGLREEIVASSDQVLDLMEFGECNLIFEMIKSIASSFLKDLNKILLRFQISFILKSSIESIFVIHYCLITGSMNYLPLEIDASGFLGFCLSILIYLSDFMLILISRSYIQLIVILERQI